MKSSLNFLNSLLLAVVFSFLAGCAGGGGVVRQEAAAPTRGLRIAVLPLDNLSGGPAPVADIRKRLVSMVADQGFRVVDEKSFNGFITRHRIRYTGGIDAELARELKKELKVDYVLVTSIELYFEDTPPKIALSSRLVTTGETPVITWMESVGLAGDDEPGLLGLGLINDPKKLRDKALHVLAGSLERHVGHVENPSGSSGRYAPKISYSAVKIPDDRKPSIAVIPFYNQSMRRYAGEIQVLNFVKQLVDTGSVRVIEPGVVRDSMLRMRVIMDDGISLPHIDLISIGLNVDFILTGKVFDYQDFDGGMGTPKIDFSAELVQRAGKKIVWASKSYNEGDDGVFFFDWGKLSTASRLATQMTKAVTEKMLKK